MARRLFFAELLKGAAGAPSQAVVRGSEARHLARVLRARPGMQMELAAGGERYLGTVASVTADAVTFADLERLAVPTLSGPRLIAALVKFDRFEWLLEKAAELGVAAIQPLAAERTDPRLTRAAPARLARWRRILQAAAQQSRRNQIPLIALPVGWAELALPPAAGAPSPHRWLLSEDPADPPLAGCALPATPGAVTLATGPEGGWTAGDRAAAAALEFTPCSLGPRILRAETAAIAALSYLLVASQTAE